MEWVKGGAKMEKMHTSKLLALVAGRRGITFTLLVIYSCIMYVNDTAETHADITKQVSIVPGSLPGMHACEHVPACPPRSLTRACTAFCWALRLYV
jgi:hypothetical protein